MCGICGEMRFDGDKPNQSKMLNMMDSIAKRGPDHGDEYQYDNIYLGHRRLSVIDISSKSHQPMIDKKTGNAIVFNGVVYNFKELRKLLIKKGYSFSSDGDTEVILKSYDYYGRECVKFFDGVFSFCIFDSETKELFLARDRLGIKPLYYKINKKYFSFSSNTRALIDKNDNQINHKSLHYQFTLHSVVPAPNTIFKNIYKLEPGHSMTISSKGQISKKQYYSLNDIALNKKIQENEILEESERLLIKSIGKRFYTADVDVGVLLSGGLDSSLIVAMAARSKLSDINTFSIGFPTIDNEVGDEFYYSDIVSKQFNTKHYKYNINQDHLFESLDNVIKEMPEPMFSQDSAAFYLLANQVSKKQKVVLSGQGADELFGGYFWYEKMNDANGSDSERFMGHYFDRSHDDYCNTIRKEYISNNYSEELIERLFAQQRDDISYIDKTLRIDLSTLVVDDPVKRVDSMTMAHGLETRVPFLDIDLVEFMSSIPSTQKLQNSGKYYLKKIAEKYLSKDLIYRDKFYFPVPPLKILEGKFLDYVRSILLSKNCSDRALYNQDNINTLLLNPNSYFTKLNGNKLWHLALLERWFQLNIDA
ncbi:MAG: N-acetylglutaminylglutamine amidotransferase [Gammaproteobacteria bacterium]|nr:N-acetylglutaminylglutamine amidotransferase [Gammaproteobacteria bacterium]